MQYIFMFKLPFDMPTFTVSLYKWLYVMYMFGSNERTPIYIYRNTYVIKELWFVLESPLNLRVYQTAEHTLPLSGLLMLHPYNINRTVSIKVVN